MNFPCDKCEKVCRTKQESNKHVKSHRVLHQQVNDTSDICDVESLMQLDGNASIDDSDTNDDLDTSVIENNEEPDPTDKYDELTKRIKRFVVCGKVTFQCDKCGYVSPEIGDVKTHIVNKHGFS